MSFFTRRVRQETELDRKVRAVAHWSVTPTVALIASIVACLSCAWIFVVVFAGLPRGWAREFVVVGLFIAPALAFVSARELWRSGWDIRLLLAALLSGVGFAFWCAAIYFVIHPHAR
jgi:hypothetical protein